MERSTFVLALVCIGLECLVWFVLRCVILAQMAGI